MTQAPSFGVTLNGSDATATFDLLVSVTDTRLVADGWRLESSSTVYSTGGASPRQLSETASSVIGASASCDSGFTCNPPVSTVGYPFTLPAGATPPTPVRLFNAALLTGTGRHTVSHQIRVTVPATTFAGVYTSTITVTVASGP